MKLQGFFSPRNQAYLKRFLIIKFAVVFLLFAYPGIGLSDHNSSHLPGTISTDNPVIIESGSYLLENNIWGSGSLKGWYQCISLISNRTDTLAAQWSWNWLYSGNNVKGYAEVIYGHKPGFQHSTSSRLPVRISEIKYATVHYDVSVDHNGTGNTAFDIWLTDTNNPTTFDVPPISHEIMIWLETYGDMHPAGSLFDRIIINGEKFNVFAAENMGKGWKTITFQRENSQTMHGSIDITSFLSYIRFKGIITGKEYLASIELGNEVISGTGETRLNSYSVQIN